MEYEFDPKNNFIQQYLDGDIEYGFDSLPSWALDNIDGWITHFIRFDYSYVHYGEYTNTMVEQKWNALSNHYPEYSTLIENEQQSMKKILERKPTDDEIYYIIENK